MTDQFRFERDFLGEIRIPATALYGANTARGAENFSISGRRLGEEPAFARAFAFAKLAAAQANRDLGLLSPERAEALIAACREVIEGTHHEHLIIDMLDGSGGTSFNMNINEVLANRALVLMGASPGDYKRLHPNDHVNLSQSTNDVVPAAIKMACHEMAAGLLDALDELRDAFAQKAAEFSEVLRLGRTCLQDAQPMTLGQAFGGYAALTARLRVELEGCRDKLRELPLGGTAIGTGLGSPGGYRERVFHHLTRETGVEWLPPTDAFDAMQNADTFARLSGELRTCAVSLAKIASDFILLSSGPAGGIGELRLPALQAGSSIMPGKVNPVQPMALCQASFAIVGNDTCVAMATQQGQLEVNHYEPVIAASLFSSIRILANELCLFSRKCVAGIAVDVDRTLENLMKSSAIATALVPRLGYDTVAELVRKGSREGKPFIDTIEAEGYLSREEALKLTRQAVRVT